ncbi:MAG: hypothetical protein ACI4DR_01625 [Roseburia sp.]
MKDIAGQISLFDMLGQSDKSDVDVQSYLKEAIMSGTCFVNGKKRVYELYQKNMTPSERARAIKEEYGLGGAGWPLDEYGLHGYDSFHNGLTIEWRDETGDHKKTFNWNEVERVIRSLVESGEYYKNE